MAYRSGFPTPPAGDAGAILILAGIELGVAEVAERGRSRLFALPALATALTLPLVSVVLSLPGGWQGDEPLFVLFAAGTLYAATCGRMRWKNLGLCGRRPLQRSALGALGARRLEAGRFPAVLPCAGRFHDDPLRRGQPLASWALPRSTPSVASA